MLYRHQRRNNLPSNGMAWHAGIGTCPSLCHNLHALYEPAGQAYDHVACNPLCLLLMTCHHLLQHMCVLQETLPYFLASPALVCVHSGLGPSLPVCTILGTFF